MVKRVPSAGTCGIVSGANGDSYTVLLGPSARKSCLPNSEPRPEGISQGDIPNSEPHPQGVSQGNIPNEEPHPQGVGQGKIPDVEPHPQPGRHKRF